MTATRDSQRTVFRHIARDPHYGWPSYDSTPFYDRSTLAAVEKDVREVASVWFEHNAHESVEEFVCRLPLVYLEFAPHDRYTSSTQYEMEQLFRGFILKEIHGWEHETALIEYLAQYPNLCGRLGLETVPDQSTLWRSWHKRFTPERRTTVETAARTILIKAQNAGVTVPRNPDRHLPSHRDEADESNPADQAVLDNAATITEHISRIVFPAFSVL